MDDLVNHINLSIMKSTLHHFGKHVQIENFTGDVRSIQLKTANCVFEFQTRWNGNLDPIFVILLDEKQYMLFGDTVGNYMSSEDMDLYIREMHTYVQFVDSSIPAGAQAHFILLARTFFKARDGSSTKRAK